MTKKQSRGTHARKACRVSGKSIYPNEEQAKRQAAKRTAALHGELIDAYCCRYCGHWHIGHPPQANREVGFIPGIGRVVIKHFA